jgi:hypothetical protein
VSLCSDKDRDKDKDRGQDHRVMDVDSVNNLLPTVAQRTEILQQNFGPSLTADALNLFAKEYTAEAESLILPFVKMFFQISSPASSTRHSPGQV